MSCTNNHLVLKVNDNDLTTSPVSYRTFSPTHEHTKDEVKTKNKEFSPMSESSEFEDYHLEYYFKAGNSCSATTPPPFLPLSIQEADSSPDSSKALCTSTNVFFENLESTKVAVAQFSKELCLNTEAELTSNS